jgi:hypothetical protein
LSRLDLELPIGLAEPSTELLPACQWGYVPNFFSQRPPRSSRARDLPLVPLGRHAVISGWVARGDVVDPALPSVYVTAGDDTVATARVDSRPELFVPGDPSLGFEADVPLRDGLALDDLVVWVRRPDGSNARLPWSSHADDGGPGGIEHVVRVWEDAVTIPPDAGAFRWLELRWPDGHRSPDSFLLSQPNLHDHSIAFATRDVAPDPYFVRLDSCNQWQDMPGTTAILTHQERQSGLVARLRA